MLALVGWWSERIRADVVAVAAASKMLALLYLTTPRTGIGVTDNTEKPTRFCRSGFLSFFFLFFLALWLLALKAYECPDMTSNTGTLLSEISF